MEPLWQRHLVMEMLPFSTKQMIPWREFAASRGMSYGLQCCIMVSISAIVKRDGFCSSRSCGLQEIPVFIFWNVSSLLLTHGIWRRNYEDMVIEYGMFLGVLSSVLQPIEWLPVDVYGYWVIVRNRIDNSLYGVKRVEKTGPNHLAISIRIWYGVWIGLLLETSSWISHGANGVDLWKENLDHTWRLLSSKSIDS